MKSLFMDHKSCIGAIDRRVDGPGNQKDIRGSRAATGQNGTVSNIVHRTKWDHMGTIGNKSNQMRPCGGHAGSFGTKRQCGKPCGPLRPGRTL